jgi:hypothetical protein
MSALPDKRAALDRVAAMLGPRRTAGAGCCGCVAENELQAVAANIARTGQRFRAERMDFPARNAISECGAECVPGSKLRG